MANTHSNLTGLFTDIADAIREKTGGTATIVANQFPAAIAAIESIPENAVMLNETSITLPDSDSWYSVAYGDGKFVVVANNSAAAAYSTDGFAWHAATLPATADWCSITYGSGKFVAVAEGSASSAYSTDGITWFTGTMPSSADWCSVTYGAGKFVAVGYNSNKVAYSTDGASWNAATMQSSAMWQSVTYGAGKFVAVSFNNTKVAYSYDGITWTESTLSSKSYWNQVIYANGKFVTVAKNAAKVAHSTDGITWTEFALPSGLTWESIAWGDGKFVAVASGISASSSKAIYSTDCITWVETPMPGYLKWKSVIYANGKFVAVADDSARGANSIDGITWYGKANRLVDGEGNDVTDSTVQALGVLDQLEAQVASLESEKTQLMSDMANLERQISDYGSEIGALRESWAGNLTFSGTYATATYYTAAGCSLAVDKQKGMAFVVVQGGTSTSYENVYFTATSLPSGVTMLTPPGGSDGVGFGTTGSTMCYFTAVLTGITGKINVAVAMGARSNTSYDAVNCALTVTYA